MFFDQELPHINFLVCRFVVMMKTCHSTIPTCCIKFGYGSEWEPASRSADSLFHPQAQIHDEPYPSDWKKRSAWPWFLILTCAPSWAWVILQSSTACFAFLYQITKTQVSSPVMTCLIISGLSLINVFVLNFIEHFAKTRRLIFSSFTYNQNSIAQYSYIYSKSELVFIAECLMKRSEQCNRKFI